MYSINYSFKGEYAFTSVFDDKKKADRAYRDAKIVERFGSFYSCSGMQERELKEGSYTTKEEFYESRK